MKYGVGLSPRCSDCFTITRFGVRIRLCQKNPNHKKKQSSKNRKQRQRSFLRVVKQTQTSAPLKKAA